MKSAAGTILDRAKDAVHNVQDKFHAAKESLMDAQHAMADTASKTYAKAESTMPAKATLSERIGDLKQSAQNALSGIMGGKEKVESNLPTAAEVKSTISEKIGDLKQSAQNALGGMIGKEKVEDSIQQARDKLQEARTKLPELPKTWDLKEWFGFGSSLLTTGSIFGILSRCTLITLGVQMAGFALQLATGNALHYDSFGSLNMIILALYTLFSQNSVFSVRQVVLTLMACMWAGRLGSFLFLRARRRGVDPALKELQTPMEKSRAWFAQGLWIMCCALPLIFVNAESNFETKPHSIRSLTGMDFIGFAMWIAGFAIESIADYQKATFEEYRDKEKEEVDVPFVHTGLWARCQHPNYLGEIMMWTGMYISSLSVLHGFEHIAILAPVFTYVVLRYFTGVPRVRKFNEQKYGQLESYQKYVAQTPVLLPSLF